MPRKQGDCDLRVYSIAKMRPLVRICPANKGIVTRIARPVLELILKSEYAPQTRGL